MADVQEFLLTAIRKAAIYNHDIQASPACILWPDKERQWESAIPLLQNKLSELFILGDYSPDKRTGPAIWLRCVIAGKIDTVLLPEACIPIIYIPGFSRQELRAVENCPEALKSLVELQYRGSFWTQANTKDWTIKAFLQSKQGGLGLDVAQDNETKKAIMLALPSVLEEDVSSLQNRYLDKDYFNTLLSGDPNRELLKWLDQGELFQKSLETNQWEAFVENCKSKFKFNPESEGLLSGATKLAVHESPWLEVWDRFCESPLRYPGIPEQIRRCRPPNDTLLWTSGDGSFEGWPQWNEEQEKELGKALAAASALASHAARKKIAELEKHHGKRRNLVWAELGESSLAQSLEHLSIVADLTTRTFAAGSIEDVVKGFSEYGWKVDYHVLKALTFIKSDLSLELISNAIRSIYLPWIDETTRYLQDLFSKSAYPGGSYETAAIPKSQSGDCILFIDGLRFDIAKRLKEILDERHYHTSEAVVWAALPSITATGKPAVSPVADKIAGLETSNDFEPVLAETKQPLKGHFNKLLEDAGWSVLKALESGDGNGKAWCETGNIDHEGHERGWKLATYLNDMMKEIVSRIDALFKAGWTRIRIVTDHGWLLMPGGLPKEELASVLTESKWSRSAILKPGAVIQKGMFPWYWNPNQYFALAPGISCFRNGMEYTHGGISLEECLTLQIEVTRNEAASKPNDLTRLDINWRGLRCTVAGIGNNSGYTLDIRSRPADSSTSIVAKTKLFDADGIAVVIVENEDLEGKNAFIVVLDKKGSAVSQINTVIGGVIND
jgi:hypothetical protein